MSLAASAARQQPYGDFLLAAMAALTICLLIFKCGVVSWTLNVSELPVLISGELADIFAISISFAKLSQSRTLKPARLSPAVPTDGLMAKETKQNSYMERKIVLGGGRSSALFIGSGLG